MRAVRGRCHEVRPRWHHTAYAAARAQLLAGVGELDHTTRVCRVWCVYSVVLCCTALPIDTLTIEPCSNVQARVLEARRVACTAVATSRRAIRICSVRRATAARCASCARPNTTRRPLAARVSSAQELGVVSPTARWAAWLSSCLPCCWSAGASSRRSARRARTRRLTLVVSVGRVVAASRATSRAVGARLGGGSPRRASATSLRLSSRCTVRRLPAHACI